MKIKELKLISYIYIILPIIIFLLGFLKPIFSIPITIVLCIILYKLFYMYKKEDSLFVEKNDIIFILFFAFIICIFAGHGKFFYQSSDYTIRNAVFRDLVTFKWPVYYKNNTALSYYIGQWMVPSLIGKLFSFLNPESAFMKANMALLIWNAIGVTLSILWVIKITNSQKKYEKFICFLVFLFFSGLDIIGATIFGELHNSIHDMHLEWWGEYFQYSSMITQLFWVFNQCIVPWITTLMFFDEKRVNNYVLLIVITLPYGPIPSVGLAMLLFIRGIIVLIKSLKNREIRSFIKDVFSMQNILTLILILPFFYFYYFSNAAVQGDSNGGGGFSIISELFSKKNIFSEILFWLLEVGVYGIVLFRKHKKDILFYYVLFILIIIPFFGIGYQYDFSMRASIPLLVIVDLWVVEYLIELINSKKNSYHLIILIVLLCVGFVTPFFEFYRGINYFTNNIYNESADSQVTLDTDDEGISNFVVRSPKEKSIFYKYFAK